MKAAELRQSILQAAVQGKLVPQNVHDEPASELLKRIQQEKVRLVKEGKIKKEKLLPPIAEDEVDLPDGWAWCRLGNITTLITSGSRDWAKFYAKEGAVFLRMGNLSKDSFNLRLHSIQYVSPPTNSEGNRTRLEANDILVSITGDVGSLGKIPQDFGEAYINQHTALIRFPVELQNEYFPFAFLSPFCKNQFDKPQRGIKNSFRLTDLSYMFIPLPPIAEQQRIVAKVYELMALCDELEAAEKELDTLEKRFEDYLPKSILQAAVQGKLVPQNVHDEPASELLRRIQQEKARLVKEGKIKREKPLPPIAEDEIPYDLPDGWVWCRLGEVIQLAENNNIHKNLPEDTLVNYVDIDAIDNKKYCIKEVKQLPVKELSSRARRVLQKGFVVYSLVRPYLNNIAIIEDDKENYIGSTGFVVFKPINIETNYFISFLLSPFVETYYFSMLSGFNSPSVSQEDFLSTLFPLPPIAEQQRIVSKMDELIALCYELKAATCKTANSNIVPFPQQDEDEELLMVAQGEVSGKLSKELRQAQEDLFGDGADE